MAFDGQASIYNIANIMQRKYGMSPETVPFFVAQLEHESGRGTSRLAQENHNFGGLTQTTPNGEDNKQPDGGNYYRVFNSDEDYADAMYKDFFSYYPEIMKAKDANTYAQILKNNGYYGAPLEEYTNAISSLAKEYNPNAMNMSYSPSGANGSPLATANIKLEMDDTNEKLDIPGLMQALQVPKQGPAAAADRAVRDNLLLQAQHAGLGAGMNRFFEKSDDALMKSAIAKAQEEANINNERATLTAAGKVAQMIANSHNSSNSKMMASLAGMMGIKLDPMADRYVNQNQLALNYIQQQNAANEAEKQRVAAKQLQNERFAFQREQDDKNFARNLLLADMKAKASQANGGLTLSQSNKQNQLYWENRNAFDKELQTVANNIYTHGTSNKDPMAPLLEKYTRKVLASGMYDTEQKQALLDYIKGKTDQVTTDLRKTYNSDGSAMWIDPDGEAQLTIDD